MVKYSEATKIKTGKNARSNEELGKKLYLPLLKAELLNCLKANLKKFQFMILGKIYPICMFEI